MDSYRGHFSDRADPYDPLSVDEDIDSDDGLIPCEPPPSPVGQDERRMQVRAYNLWASLLGARTFPSVDDLKTEEMPELAPYAVLLDFENGIENPTVSYLGDKLAEECGTEGAIRTLADIPSRSLLSRITDHYMQIIANEAPIGFEAEFVNQRGKTVVYRGILLPFAREDGDTIQHILGVINWKELADQATTDALLAEVDAALNAAPLLRGDVLPGWTEEAGVIDGEVPLELDGECVIPPEPDFGPELTPDLSLDMAGDFAGEMTGGADVLDLGKFGDVPFPDVLLPDAPLPRPSFGAGDDAGATAPAPAPVLVDEQPRDLAGWLASARALAEAAQGAEDRTRAALYAAIGRAWDFALAAAEAPEEFAALVAGAGLAVQERAPLTPVVKLVFGADYDKTRLTEYATALAHAQRLALPRGALADTLAQAVGGLKGVVQEERKLRRAATAPASPVRKGPREALVRKLRKMAPRPLESFATGNGEFAVLLARRLENGEVVLIGEAEDAGLLDKAARRIARA